MKALLLIPAVALVACSKPKKPEAAAPTPKVEVLYATPVEGMPGYVKSPYAPDDGYVDVRGYPPNTEVKDPYSGNKFLVP